MPSVSVAIAAYKAQNNIVPLISSLLIQESNDFEFKEIVVHCDGLEDSTHETASKNFSKRTLVPIKFIQTTPRQGYANAIKNIFISVKSDIVITLNDDIKITDNKLLSKIVFAFQENPKVAMVTGRPVALPNTTFFGKALASVERAYHGNQYKTANGNTAKTVDGKLMAFSRSFIRTFVFPENLEVMGNVDSYLYFSLREADLEYKHVYDAIIYGKNPATVSDFVKFSSRCGSANKLLQKNFGKELVNNEYKIDPKTLFKGVLQELLKNPPGLLFIFLLNQYIKLNNLFFPRKFVSKWELINTAREIN